MSRGDKHILRLLKEKSKEVMPPGARVFLYGSRARGDQHMDSDWDILILVDKPKADMSDYDDLSYPLTELGWKYGASIIPIVYGKDEWNHVSSLLFRRNIEKDAIALI